jgi:glycosyltransferase involved in cell wall biosynthesis
MDDQVGTARPLKIRGWAQSEAGSGMYRVDVPLWGLRGFGHETVSIVGLDEVPEDTDVVIGQVIADEPRLELWRELSRRPGRRPVMVAELDDALWNLHGSNEGALGLRSREAQARLEEFLRLADAVTVTTPELGEVVSCFNENVYVMPNCIDLNLLLHERPKPERRTVGWTVSASHAMDVDDVAGVLSHYLRRHRDIDLHLIGQDFTGRFHAPNVRHSPWREELTEYLHGVDFHVGIAPLKYHAFNKGRSDVKALEYAALGIPVIASDFGPYPSSIVHGETGFLVKQPHEWATYLNLLLNDDDARNLMGLTAKLWASSRTIQGNAWRWELAYRETITTVHGDPIPGLLCPLPQGALESLLPTA